MRSKHTTPELALRKSLRDLGINYRLHRRELPGTPDIVVPNGKLAIFVHGCYWHRHAPCVGKRFNAVVSPEWAERFNAVVRNDETVTQELRAIGWNTHVSWECNIQANAYAEARQIERMLSRLKAQ